MDDKNARLNAEGMAGRSPDRPAYEPYTPDRAGHPGATATPAPVPSPTVDTSAAATAAAAAADDDSSERTRQIRSEIEQTREEMSQTVNAIQERLRPGAIAANAAETVRTGAANAAESVRTGAQQLADTPGVRYMREYPLPAAALACGVAGLAWLAMGSRGNGTDGSRAARYPSGPSRRSRGGARGMDDAGQEFQASSWTVEDWGGPASRPSRRPAGYAAAPRHRSSVSSSSGRRRADPQDHRFAIGAAVAAAGAVAAVTLAGPERARSWIGQLWDDLAGRVQDVRRQLQAEGYIDPTYGGPTTSLYEPDLPGVLPPDTLVSETVIIDRPLS